MHPALNIREILDSIVIWALMGKEESNKPVHQREIAKALTFVCLSWCASLEPHLWFHRKLSDVFNALPLNANGHIREPDGKIVSPTWPSKINYPIEKKC